MALLKGYIGAYRKLYLLTIWKFTRPTAVHKDYIRVVRTALLEVLITG